MADLPASSPSIPVLLQRYLNGETIRSLAAEAKVNRQTIYNWMLGECGPDYEQLITKALINRIAEADDMMENSPDTLGFARGREMGKFARQDFERKRPKLYGQKQEVQVDHTVNITVNRGPVILPVVSEPSIIQANSDVSATQEKSEWDSV
jgi:transcriptional regulator with XRE-family HTH domain